MCGAHSLEVNPLPPPGILGNPGCGHVPDFWGCPSPLDPRDPRQPARALPYDPMKVCLAQCLLCLVVGGRARPLAEPAACPSVEIGERGLHDRKKIISRPTSRQSGPIYYSYWIWGSQIQVSSNIPNKSVAVCACGLWGVMVYTSYPTPPAR